MSPLVHLALYAFGISLGSLVGAAVPLARKPDARRTRMFLSFSAGVMLGAAFLHMLPEALAHGSPSVLGWVPAGFLFLYLLERYVLVHFCDEPAGCEIHGPHEAHGSGVVHLHAHAHDDEHGKSGRPAAATLGIATFVGLTLHTLTDGIALGAALETGVAATVFFAILVHKVPSSFSLAAILLHDRHSARRTLLLSVLFSLAVPVGALVYFAASRALDLHDFGPATLAFSAGTFLHLAAADILPDLHRDKAMRIPLSLSLVAGTTLMGLLSIFGPGHAH